MLKPYPPWFELISLHDDLRQGSPLDASEFTLHLEQIRQGSARAEEQDPLSFLERTHLTQELGAMVTAVWRRLAGEESQAAAIFALTTPFGGGKTHALALLYHLATANPQRLHSWTGLPSLLRQIGLTSLPQVATAVFAGTDFDSLQGRGGLDGTPWRRTPWGEIAFQLCGEEGLRLVASHEEQGIAPGGDVIRQFLPRDRPCLLLFDEWLNYTSRHRHDGLGEQSYHFVQNLCEEARRRRGVVLLFALPSASSLELTPAARQELERWKKLLARLGKTVTLSFAGELARILRRRLFVWPENARTPEGDYLLPPEARDFCHDYVLWLQEQRRHLPASFALEEAQLLLEQSYPFHPALLSLLENRWRHLPRFQQTRGALRLLALWLSALAPALSSTTTSASTHTSASTDASPSTPASPSTTTSASTPASPSTGASAPFSGEWTSSALATPLLTTGLAPLGETLFRQALLEQWGREEWEPILRADISSGPSSHAEQLDARASAALRSLQLHRQVATTLFLEAGGKPSLQAGPGLPLHETDKRQPPREKSAFFVESAFFSEGTTLAELYFHLAGPHLSLSTVDASLEGLLASCYHLSESSGSYNFHLQPNQNKQFADRCAAIKEQVLQKRLHQAIKAEFPPVTGLERVFFPERSRQIPDHPALTLALLSPKGALQSPAKLSRWLLSMSQRHGRSARICKSALLWLLPQFPETLYEKTRSLLAWESLAQEERTQEESPPQKAANSPREKGQRVALSEARGQRVGSPEERLHEARRDLRESIWHSYRQLALLNETGDLQTIDLDLSLVDEGTPLPQFLLERLRHLGLLAETVSPRFLLRHWPPALSAWSTRAVRDTFYASPRFPRLLDATTLQQTIAEGVAQGLFACVGLNAEGRYLPFHFHQEISPASIDFSEERFLLPAEMAQQSLNAPPATPVPPSAVADFDPSSKENSNSDTSSKENSGVFTWQGEIPPRQWSDFYLRFLSKLVARGKISLQLTVEATPHSPLTKPQQQKLQAALRALGLPDQLLPKD